MHHITIIFKPLHPHKVPHLTFTRSSNKFIQTIPTVIVGNIYNVLTHNGGMGISKMLDKDAESATFPKANTSDISCIENHAHSKFCIFSIGILPHRDNVRLFAFAHRTNDRKKVNKIIASGRPSRRAVLCKLPIRFIFHSFCKVHNTFSFQFERQDPHKTKRVYNIQQMCIAVGAFPLFYIYYIPIY